STNRDERVSPGTVLSTKRGPLTIRSSSPHQHGWIVRFAEINTREQAEEARGVVLSAPPLDLPDELWVHELVGSQVFDTSGGVLDLRVHDLRLAATDVHRTVDDSPFGGGAGMVLAPEPVFAAVEQIDPPRPLLLLTPAGRTFTQSVARELLASGGFSLLCGRY